jgi:hypothetical protein
MNVLRSMMSTWELKCVEGGRFAPRNHSLSGLTHKPKAKGARASARVATLLQWQKGTLSPFGLNLRCAGNKRGDRDEMRHSPITSRERQHFLNLIRAWRPSPRRLHDSTPSVE